jgi:N-formylglutamate deformylase
MRGGKGVLGMTSIAPPSGRPVEVSAGDGPVVLAMPHTGTWLPDSVSDRLNEVGRGLADTDWHIDRLYAGLLPRATIVRATFHRYLIDANRGPDGASLYPGQNTTGLCPLTDFEGRPIWRDGAEPTAADVADHTAVFHAPYHAALAAEIARVRARHGVAILYDCHSIRSEIPFLFDGTLPDLNVGTNEGMSCAPVVEAATLSACRAATGHSYVANGRFKGGWTTRHYGRPDEGVHAIQMELAQATYMQERPPWDYVAERAKPLREHLRALLEALEDLAPTLAADDD